MSDFRDVLYARYASSFKEGQGLDDERLHAGYLRWARHRILPLLDGVPREASVLEVGCGSGALLQLLRQEGFRNVRGVDVAPEMVARARAEGLEVVEDDVVRFLQRDERTHRLVLAMDFVEHFSKDELMTLVPLLAQRLEPGGVLMIQTPNGSGLLPNRVVHGDLTHLTVFTPSSLEQLLRLFGFSRFHFAETGPTPSSLKGAVRTILWSAVRTVAMAAKAIETGQVHHIWTENMLCRCEKL